MSEEAQELPESLTRLKTLSNDLDDLRQRKDRLELELEEVNGVIKTLKQEMLVMMQNSGLDLFRTPRGTFYTSTTTRARVADKEKAFAWLRDAGLGGLIQETVNAQSLSADIRRMASDGQVALETLEAHGISVYIDETVNVRKK